MEKEEVKYTEIEKTTLFETDYLMVLRFDIKRGKEKSDLTTFLIVGLYDFLEFLVVSQKDFCEKNRLLPDTFPSDVEYCEEVEFYVEKIKESFGIAKFIPLTFEKFESVKSISDGLYSHNNDEENEAREVLRSLLINSDLKFCVDLEVDFLKQEIKMYDGLIEQEQKKVDRQMKTNVWLNNYKEEREELKKELKELKVNTFKRGTYENE